MSIAYLLAGILVAINLAAIGMFEKRGTTHIVSHKTYPYIISFGGGVTIAYIFLNLFPRIVEEALALNKLILLLVLAGFFIFHLIEKYLYKHLPRDEFKKEYRVFHLSVLALFKFAEGVVLFELSKESVTAALLFFIPLFFLSLNEDFSLHNWHGKKEFALKLAASIAALLGVAAAALIPFSLITADIILALVTGALIYLAITTLTPKEKGGRLWFLLAGTFLYVLVFVLYI